MKTLNTPTMEIKPQTPKLEIFVQSPDLQIPTRALTLDPSLSLRQISPSLFPQFQTLILNSSIFFTSNGRPIPDSTPIRNTQIAPLSTLTLRFRLPGGGGDGGSTCAESRDCYLNMYAEKKPDKVDPNEKRLSKWLNCALSNEPLKRPVVVDKLGNVFNKEKLVEALLSKNFPKEFGHIKGLKDMIDVEMELVRGAGSDGEVARFRCPITDLEFNGKYKFFALRSCGHVLSAKALKEVKSEACLVCHKEFAGSDKIVINGSEDEVADLRERMKEERGRMREMKAKKAGVGLDLVRMSGKKHGVDEVAKGLGKAEVNGVGNLPVKRFKAVDMAPPGATKEVYASIFTSSRKSDFKETYSCRSLPLGRN